MNYPIISDDAPVQAAYEGMRREGTSHNLAEMFALRQGPALMTDNVFLEGHCNGSQFADSPALGDHYKQEATAAGVDTTGKVYLSGLAAFPGDPRAWVAGRGDVQRVVEERGWDCDGAVKVRAFRPEERSSPEIDEALVEEELRDGLACHPEPQRVDQVAAKEEIRAKRRRQPAVATNQIDLGLKQRLVQLRKQPKEARCAP